MKRAILYTVKLLMNIVKLLAGIVLLIPCMIIAFFGFLIRSENLMVVGEIPFYLLFSHD